MEKIKICRTIKSDGSIQKGSGIELGMSGPTANLLQGVTTPLFSNPITGEIAEVLAFPEETKGEYMKGILISPAGASRPPEHFHPNYVEEFTIIEGAFTFLYNKEIIFLKAGDKLSVQANEPHTFRSADKYDVNTFIAVVRPPGLLTELVKTGGTIRSGASF